MTRPSSRRQLASFRGDSASGPVFSHRLFDQRLQLLGRYRNTFGSICRVIARYWTTGTDRGRRGDAVTRTSLEQFLYVAPGEQDLFAEQFGGEGNLCKMF